VVAPLCTPTLSTSIHLPCAANNSMGAAAGQASPTGGSATAVTSQALWNLLTSIWRSTWSTATHWRNTSCEMVDERLRSLKSGGGPYRRALIDFHNHCVAHRLILITVADVDAALVRFCSGLRRAKVEVTFCAVLRAYPPLRGELPWSAALVSDMSSLQPTTHHTPMPWGVALMIAHYLRTIGRLDRAVGLLVQWRLGLRPGEMLQLRPADIQFSSTGVALVALDMRCGTKVRRRAAVRVLPTDWRTHALLRRIVLSVPADALITSWRRVPEITADIRDVCRHVGLEPRWTSHCPRAGWATAQFTLGTPFGEIMEMGRWSSPASLRTYLDVVASDAIAAAPDVSHYQEYMQWLDATFLSAWSL
jgi:integrase